MRVIDVIFDDVWTAEDICPSGWSLPAYNRPEINAHTRGMHVRFWNNYPSKPDQSNLYLNYNTLH